MTFHVVDENVLVVANRDSHASEDCVEKCIDFLLKCRDDESLVVDNARLILDKYGNHCSHSGQPGTGGLFFVWARDNAARLRSTQLDRTDDRSFAAFPLDDSLATFDIDDRIWVAAALETCAVIVNAVDSDYTHHADELRAAGVEVLELCPEELKER